MAEDDIVQRVVLDGDKTVIKQFDDIEKAGKNAFKNINDAANAASSGGGFKSIGAAFANVYNSLKTIGPATKDVRERFGELQTASKETGKGILEATAIVTGFVVGLALLANSTAHVGDEIAKTSAALGINSSAYQQLAFVAGQAGVSSEAFALGQSRLSVAIDGVDQNTRDYNKSVRSLNRDFALGRVDGKGYTDQLADLRFGLQNNETAFDKIGVTIARNRDGSANLEETELRLADAFQKSTNSVLKTTVARELFGRGATRMVGFLNKGREAIMEERKEAERLGLVIGEDVLKRQEKLNDAFDKLDKAATSTRVNVIGVFSPTIVRIIDGIVEAMAHWRAELVATAANFANKLVPVVDDFIALISGKEGDIAKDSIVLQVRDAVVSTASAIKSAVNDIILPALKSILTVLNVLAEGINGIFGTHLTGAALGVALIIGKFIGLLPLLSSGFQLAFSVVKLLSAALGGPLALALVVVGSIIGVKLVQWLKAVDWEKWGQRASDAISAVVGFAKDLGQFFSDAWTVIRDGATAVWTIVSDAAGIAVDFIKTKFDNFIIGLQAIWDFIKSSAEAGWSFVSDQATIAVDYIGSIFTDLKNLILGIWDAVKNKILAVWDSVKGIIQAITGGGGDTGSLPAQPQSLAAGGPVRGPGGPKSDVIPIWASNGEFMQPYAAVKKYGLGFMEAIRTLRFDPQGFNLGGLITFNAPQPRMRYAEGGPISGGRGGTLNLTIDGQTFSGLSANEDTMGSLTKFATNRQLRSAGRKPLWVK